MNTTPAHDYRYSLSNQKRIRIGGLGGGRKCVLHTCCKITTCRMPSQTHCSRGMSPEVQMSMTLAKNGGGGYFIRQVHHRSLSSSNPHTIVLFAVDIAIAMSKTSRVSNQAHNTALHKHSTTYIFHSDSTAPA